MTAIAIGEPLGLLHVVRREEDGLAELAQAADHLPRGAARRGVEAGRRLVEEDQLRVADQRQRDVEPPPLSAGQRRGALVGLRGEVDQRERLVDLARSAVVAGVEREALADAQAGLGLGFLQDDADPLAPARRRAPRVAAEDLDRRRRGLAEALEDLDRRRLAGAVGAEEGEDLAAADLQVDAADRLGSP